MGDVVSVSIEVLGPTHSTTLVLEAKVARISLARSGDATPLRDVVQRMEAALGAEHQQTRKYAGVLQAL